MGITIVLPGAMMAVFLSLLAIGATKWNYTLQPIHDIVVQTVFEVVDIDAGGNVHRVHQDQTIDYSAGTDDPLDILGYRGDRVTLR